MSHSWDDRGYASEYDCFVSISNEEDLAVVDKVLSGDREAFAILLEKYQGKVRGYCANMIFNSVESDDLAQEIFLKAYKSLASFDGSAKFSTWLFSISSNHCKDHLRKAKVRKFMRFDSSQELSADEDPLADLESRESIRRILSSFSEQNRQILLLREYYGFTYEEIASHLKISIESVRARLKRIRGKIDKSFAELARESGIKLRGIELKPGAKQ
ncbi:hypothetical protein BVY02_00085 [bacterium J17]|nr:hypothetical protein BVY02_00085 [bacterium J17]